jgi:hypothetical protein
MVTCVVKLLVIDYTQVTRLQEESESLRKSAQEAGSQASAEAEARAKEAAEVATLKEEAHLLHSKVGVRGQACVQVSMISEVGGAPVALKGQ